MAKRRNILAAFKTPDIAQQAAREIEQLGVDDIQVDQVGKYPGNHLNDLTNPITGNFESLSDLTLGSFTNKSAEILASSDVSASGMADGSGTEIDQNVLVTIVIDENKARNAERIIEKYNGQY